MKKYLTIIILLSSQLLLAQSSNQFSLETEKFEIELVKFLSNKSSNGAMIANNFVQDYSSYSLQRKKLVIELLNSVRKTKLKKIEFYNQALQSIILIDSIKKGNSASSDTWLIAYKKFISNKKISSKDKGKFVESNYNVLANSILNPISKRNNWSTAGDLVYNSKDIIKYTIKGGDLSCASGNDRLSIAEVEASFLPSTQKIEVTNAKILWKSNSFSSDSLYVTTKKISIDVLKNEYKIDSAILHDSYFFKKAILGSLVGKTETKIIEKKRYPEFKSHLSNYYFKNITPGVDFNGGVMIRNNTFYGVGDKYRKAILHCKKYERDAFLFSSKSFILTKSNIVSPNTDIRIRFMGDSIYHPDVSMIYDIGKANLVISKNGNKLSESPYSNSFNNLDMYIKSITWFSGSKTAEFITEAHVSVPFVSNNYYEREIFRQFQGLNNVNPLVGLYDVYMYSEAYDYLTIDYISDQMGIPKQYATHLLMQLSTMGYIYVDVELNKVTFSEKFLNIVEVYKGKKDYDVILFNTFKEKSTKGIINLDSGNLSLLDIDRITLSTKKKVYVFPSDTVNVVKDLNLSFDGEVIVGDYQFHGSKYSFDYEKFTIEMNGNQQMHYYVPSWTVNEKGEYYKVKVINPIDSLRGELYIDFPTNKSGKINYSDYPKFKNTRDAYVFYDIPEIRDSIYSRDELYMKLTPFEVDSLTTKSSRDVKFYGTIHTGDIFPDLYHYVRVQKDFSLGFVYLTGDDEISIYNKGLYNDEITMNMKGLNGRGYLSYLSSVTESNNIEFYPDSLKAIAERFDVDYTINDSLNTPLGFADNVSVYWEPNIDSMYIAKQNKSFKFYDGSVELDGDLAFIKNELTANGDILFETAEMSSGYYNFYGDSINSDLLDFKLKETLSSPSEVEISNTAGVVDMIKREGRFMLNEKNAFVEFITSKYIAYIDSVVWKMDDQRIELTSTDDKKTPWFVSVDPAQDSLRFQASEAFYSLASNKLDISKLIGIEVADAFISPDNNKLEILDNGWMQGFDKSTVKIGVGANEHILENASIEIHSSKNYSGSAEYFYTDSDSIRHPIELSTLYVDTLSGKSIGRGEILADDEDPFMLNPYFSFNGSVEVSGASEYLRFQGYSGIQNYCDDIDAGEIPIEGNVDPNNVKVDITNFDNLPEYSFIYNGIYAADSSYSAAFLSTNRDLIEVDFISAKGSITYDEPEACYTIGGETIGGVKQDEVRFYNDECRLGAKGELKFYNPDKVFIVKSYGNIDYDMNAEIIQTQMILGLKFSFNRVIMDEIRRELQIASSKGVFERESKIQKLGFSRLLKKPYGNSGSFERVLPQELQFNVLFSDLEFFWNAEHNLFLSGKDIGVHNFNGHLVNKFFNGRIEIKKHKSGDEITMYIVTQNGKYLYFSFKNTVMNFYTNNKSIMEKFDKIDDEDRVKEINGTKYRYKKASKLKVRSFQNKYI